MSMGIRRLKHPIDHRLGLGNPVNHAVEEWPFLIMRIEWRGLHAAFLSGSYSHRWDGWDGNTDN